MKSALFAVIFAVMPQIALALSCMPYGVQDAFVEAQSAKEQFVVVHGTLEFNAKQLPPRDMSNQQPEDTVLNARLRGRSLSLTGFTNSYEKPVTVVLSCAGPWCAQAEAGADVLAFVALGPDSNIITDGPCGGYLFARPTAQMLRDVTGCFRGESCAPSR